MAKMRLFKEAARARRKPEPYYVYDAGIEDVEERREKRLHFPSARATAEYVGLRNCFDLIGYSNPEAIRKQKKFHSKKQNKIFIIRKA